MATSRPGQLPDDSAPGRREPERQPRSTRWPIVGIGSIVFLASYVISYYVFVDRPGQVEILHSFPVKCRYRPEYPIRGAIVEAFYFPIHKIDVMARPDHWHCEFSDMRKKLNLDDTP